VVAVLALAACGQDGEDVVVRAPAARTPTAAAVTVVAAGDIARNADDGRGTARLIARIRPDHVLTLGDNAYDDGADAQYLANYDPTWGRFRSITRPVPGNHEYGTPGARGYFQYFADQVRGRPYYAWTAGAWRMYALNCEIDCRAGSAQLAWLAADLARHSRRPALAYVHEPRFTCSTHHPPYVGLSAIWTELMRARGRIMLAGHNHAYERFAKQDAAGVRNRDGLRQFVVGTGGAGVYPLRPTCRNRLAEQAGAFGVLRLDLYSDHYTWRFVAVGGRVLDTGRGKA
jgi:hypothetical protein